MSTDPRLTDLVRRWHELRRQGEPVTPEQLCLDCPDLVEALRAQPSRAGDPLPQTELNVPPPPLRRGNPGVVSRYEPLRLHARGGLGEVYVAHDVELNREVALKQMQEHVATHPELQ